MKANWYKVSSIAYILYAFVMPVLVLLLYIHKEDSFTAGTIELILFLGLGIITIMTIITYLCSYNPLQRELSALKEFQQNLYNKIEDEYTTSREITDVLANVSNLKYSVSISLESYLNEFLYNVPNPLKIDHKTYDKLLSILIEEKKENPLLTYSDREKQLILSLSENKDINNFASRTYPQNNSRTRTFVENIHPNYIGIIVGLIGAIMAILIRLV